ncbi:fatty acyl-AMP ligase [Shivajiella indica]|uniref:Fatty acyl-AMP ligase n=1 Tax=Shivajiella indica TaxID=872115 RepID=A0ABW5B6H1_9BACT
MISTPTTLVEILKWRGKNQSDKLALRFLKDGELDEVTLNYGELDLRARALGAQLQVSVKAGERVLLLLPPGLDFIVAYFACIYSNTIAVPLPPPHPARLEFTLTNTFRIIKDALPTAAILNPSLYEAILADTKILNQFRGIKLVLTMEDSVKDWAESWKETKIKGDDIAFLQYTSGSTTAPKGVMVSHGNLIHNLGLIENSFGQTGKSETVIWLPPYHDMGLIGGILQPLYTGNPVTLIPHLLFLQRPIRWLQAISRYKATTSGGPNFAYDLCLRKVRPEQRDLLDLSSWEVAFNGAEPVSYATMEQFADYFASCGFRLKSFLPCYGLAESTLLVTGGPKCRLPVAENIDKAGLEKDQVILTKEKNNATKTVVGCGQIRENQTIKIVDPETQKICSPDQIGEIWVSSPSVAKGYWNKPLETSSTFGAHFPDSGEGPFLRTGDLGFIHKRELFITGRLKSLIIVDGKNYYSHDIERTVQESHPSISPLGCAVFSVENSGKEQIIVIAEVPFKSLDNTEEVKKSIKRSISENHDLPVQDIRLVLPGSIPKTTSGKIKHFVCRQNYLSNTLKELIHI